MCAHACVRVYIRDGVGCLCHLAMVPLHPVLPIPVWRIRTVGSRIQITAHTRNKLLKTKHRNADALRETLIAVWSCQSSTPPLFIFFFFFTTPLQCALWSSQLIPTGKNWDQSDDAWRYSLGQQKTEQFHQDFTETYTVTDAASHQQPQRQPPSKDWGSKWFFNGYL